VNIETEPIPCFNENPNIVGFYIIRAGEEHFVEKILVAYDDSEEARKALYHAKNLIEEDDEIIITWVIPPLEDKAFAKVAADMKVSEARSILKELVLELKNEKIKARIVVKTGEVAENILKIAAENNCKLIVVGYKGISKIGRFSLGSVADKISRYADRPVLIIK
jgi:nucleotide-binding universal stress UspA family protein